MQRGNNRSACFLTDGDRTIYLHWLNRYARALGVSIHAWVLMSNHVHLLVSPESPRSVSQLMQALGRRYVRYFNERLARSGTLWEGRFRACPIHAEDYLFACMRYIEMNPVRAGLTSSPEEYRWSSFRANAQGLPDATTSMHALYASLGRTHAERRVQYRALFGEMRHDALLADIRSATRSGHLLATPAVRARMEADHGVRLGAGRRGRRPKSASDSAPSEIGL